MLLNVSDREFHHILAALEWWYASREDRNLFENAGFDDIATNGGSVKALEGDELGALCYRINVTSPQIYLIQNKFSPQLWWNNETGWGSCAGADLFDNEERQELQAPVEGIWVPLQDLPIEVDRKEREIQLWMDSAPPK